MTIALLKGGHDLHVRRVEATFPDKLYLMPLASNFS